VFGESLGWLAIAGIAVLCAGILSMACSMHSGRRHGVLLALLNAVVIAAYTLVDGVGVRLSAAPASYTLWIFLLCGLPLPLWAALRQPAALCALRRDWWRGLLGGWAPLRLTVSPCGQCCRHRLPWWRRCGKPPSCSPCCWRGWCWANTPGGCACWPHW
jgi:hypothetical protein